MAKRKNDQAQSAANTPNEGLLNSAPAAEGGVQAAAENTGNQSAEQSGTAQSATPDAGIPPQGGETGAVVSEDSSPSAEGGEKEGGTGASSPENGKGVQTGSGTAPNPPDPLKEGKKRIQHPGKQNKKVIVGQAVVEFDAEGIAELNTAQAEYLLDIPGYKEIKEDA